MIADPKPKEKYDPYEKKKYEVSDDKYFRGQPRNLSKIILTEIKRPDSPDAVLVIRPGDVFELTNEEIRILLHQESGPLIDRAMLKLFEESIIPSGGDLKEPVTSAETGKTEEEKAASSPVIAAKPAEVVNEVKPEVKTNKR